jgi:hypothetical protein
MNELSTVMKRKMRKKPQTGAYAVKASMWEMSTSVTRVSLAHHRAVVQVRSRERGSSVARRAAPTPT